MRQATLSIYIKLIDTPEKAYWLGFIYADGYVRDTAGHRMMGIALSERDRKHLEAFKDDIQATYLIHTYTPAKTSSSYSSSPYCRIQIFGDDICDDLQKHGVATNKTNMLRAPSVEENLVPHFIRGYFDGDGCIAHTTTTNTYSIKICGTEEILVFIKAFVEKNKVAKINKFHKRRPHHTVMSIEVGGNFQVKKFLDLLYENSTIHLERKHLRYTTLCDLLHSRAQ